MGKMIKIFWRDIPSHVIYKNGREKTKKQLDPKFAIAIDRAAMRAGKGSSDAYMSEWRRVIETISGNPEELVFNAVNSRKNTRIKYSSQGQYIGEEFLGYILTQSLQIDSNNVENVENISREITELLN